MSNLARYTNLHRMTIDLNVEAEIDSIEGITNNEDRQVVAAVGASVMALGMGLVEAAGNADVPDVAISNLLDHAAQIAAPTANALEGLRANVPDALDGDDIAVLGIMGMGLREVEGYRTDRRAAVVDDSPVDEEEPID